MSIINRDRYDFDKNGAGKVVGITVRALREALEELPEGALVVIDSGDEMADFPCAPLRRVRFEFEGDGLHYRPNPDFELEGWVEDHEDDPEGDDVARCVVLQAMHV